MTKTYRLHPNHLIFSIFILLLSIVTISLFGNFDIVLYICFSIVITLPVIFLGLYMTFGKVVVDDEGIIAGAKVYFDFRRSLKWDEIGSIEYKKYLFLNIINLIALGGKFVKVCRTITLSTLIKNYPQLLRDVIMRTYDVTKVASEVVKLANITEDELGNRKSTESIKIIE